MIQSPTRWRRMSRWVGCHGSGQHTDGWKGNNNLSYPARCTLATIILASQSLCIDKEGPTWDQNSNYYVVVCAVYSVRHQY